MKNNQSKGILAENIAALFLQSKNFKIIARRFYTIYGEVDIIATLDSVLVFVEVKHRSNVENFLDLISPKKLLSLKQSSEFFLQKNSSYVDKNFRYDIIFISEKQTITHIENVDIQDNSEF